MNINLKESIKMLNKIQALLYKCIWGGKNARIRQTILETDIQNGCLVTPIIKPYYYDAAVLPACSCWWEVLYLWITLI